MNACASSSARLRPRLLIVDDVADNRDLLTRRFQRRGFETAEAAGGAEAVKMVEDGGFDVVLLDIEMPDMDGLEVLRRIRQRHSASELPVIMVTGRSQHADVAAAVDAAANDYLTKPVDFELALARVETQLRKRTGGPAVDPAAPAFFTFQDPAHSLAPHPMFGVAPEELVTPLLPPEVLVQKLGGCARYIDDDGRAYIGVWGEKNVERLHSALSARLSKLVIRRERPPSARLDWRRTA